MWPIWLIWQRNQLGTHTLINDCPSGVIPTDPLVIENQGIAAAGVKINQI